MKALIHPKYYDKAEIRCSCGNIITVGSTREKLKTELCSHCHPFYTGQQKLVDTAGRVDKFQAKRAKAQALIEETKQRAEAKKKKKEVYVEKEIPQEVIERAAGKKAAGKWGAPLGETLTEEVIKEDAAKAKPKKTPAKPKKTAKKTPLSRVKKTTKKTKGK